MGCAREALLYFGSVELGCGASPRVAQAEEAFEHGDFFQSMVLLLMQESITDFQYGLS